jgi:ubiquinol-cytochrome c reductase iron-sulfur subunit
MNSGLAVCAAAICFGALLQPAQADSFPQDYISRGLAEARKGVTVDVARLGEGEVLRVQYVGRPVYVYRRTPADIARLRQQPGSELQDPRDEAFLESVRSEFGSTTSAVWARLLLSAKSGPMTTPTRSRDEAILVIAGWGPGSGCALAPAAPDERAATGIVFRDPCTGATFDAAGRAFSATSSSSSFNIAIPPYRIEGQRVVIGPAESQALPPLPFSKAELCQRASPTQDLICAARYNDIESVRAAISAGADVNYFRPGEGSPIDAAIVGSSTEVIKLLLERGAKPTTNSEKAAQLVGREDVLALLRGGKP